MTDEEKKKILEKYNVTVIYGNGDYNEIMKSVLEKNLNKYVDNYIKEYIKNL